MPTDTPLPKQPDLPESYRNAKRLAIHRLFGKFRRFMIGIILAGESFFHKRHQIFLFLRGEFQREDAFVQPSIGDAAFVVVLDDVFQCFQAAIVHVGAVRAISRRVGVLKLPRSPARPLTASRPTSGSFLSMPTPTL